VVTDALAVGAPDGHLALGPEAGELLAVLFQFADQLGRLLIAATAPAHSRAQVRDEGPGVILVIVLRVQGAGPRVTGEPLVDKARPRPRGGDDRTEEGIGEAVLHQHDVQVRADEGRHGAQAVQQVEHGRMEMCRRASRGRQRPAREVVKVVTLSRW
jgi:hypothetical protein